MDILLYDKLLNEGSPLYKWCEVYYDKQTNNNTYYLPVIYAYSLFKHKNINIIDDFTYTIEDDKTPRRIYGINNNEKVYGEKLINFVVFPLFDTLYLNGEKYSNNVFPTEHFNIILSSLDYQYKIIHILHGNLYVKYNLENKYFYLYDIYNVSIKDYQYIVSNMDKWLELKNYDNVSNYQRISKLWKNICQ